MFKISDGRSHFYQWDLNVYLEIQSFDAVDEVHFSRADMREPLTVKVDTTNGVPTVAVPNILLQVSGTVTVYAFCKNNNSGYTMVHENFNIKARPKPTDYVYTETEVITFATLEDRLMKELRDNYLPLSGGRLSGDLVVMINSEEFLVNADEHMNVMVQMYKNGYNFDGKAVKIHVNITGIDEDSNYDNYKLGFKQEKPNSCIVDWGDGKVQTTGEKLEQSFGYHVFPEVGEYTITIVCLDGMITLGDTDYYGNGNPLFYTKAGDTKYLPSAVQSIEFGEVVREIGVNCFDGCRGELEFNLPEGLECIGDYAFYGCRKPVKITVPSTVTHIGYAAFSGCEDSVEIHMLPTIPPELSEEDHMSWGDNYTLHVPKGYLETYQTATGWSKVVANMVEEE